MAGIEREFLPVAHGLEAIRGNAQRSQVGDRGSRASIAQCQIVLGGPALIAMAFDGDDPRGILFEHGRVGVEHGLAGRIDLVTVEPKKTGLSGELRLSSSSDVT